MEYKFVLRPNYVIMGDDGKIAEMFCKLCGSAIGGLTSKIIGRRQTRERQWIEEREIRFRRFHNYAELKMQFEDGSFHVTHGCSKCLTGRLAPEVLQELHMADMLHDSMNYPGQAEHMARIPVEVMAIRTDGGAIL